MSDYKTDFIVELADIITTIPSISNNLRTVILAQGCLESGFGKYGVNTRGATNNIFGLNYYNDEYTDNYNFIELNTAQEVDGKLVPTLEKFCVFDSLKDAVECIVHWYDRPKYSGIKNLNMSIKDITSMLTGTYATDSNYNKKLITLIEEYKLCDYFNTEYKICIGSFIIKENAINLMNGFKANYSKYPVSIERQFGTSGNYRVVVIIQNDNELNDIARKFSYFRL